MVQARNGDGGRGLQPGASTCRDDLRVTDNKGNDDVLTGSDDNDSNTSLAWGLGAVNPTESVAMTLLMKVPAVATGD